MTPHDCMQYEKFESLARLTGRIEEAISNLKSDIDVLFTQNRTILDKLANIEQGAAFNKGKIFIVGGIVMIMVQIGLVFLGGYIK